MIVTKLRSAAIMRTGNSRRATPIVVMIPLAVVAACSGPNPAFQPRVIPLDAPIETAVSTDVPPAPADAADDRAGDAPDDAVDDVPEEPDASPDADTAASPDATPDTAPSADLADAAVDSPADSPPAETPPPMPACSATAPAGWVCVSAGSFTMGSPANEPNRENDETAHPVTITQPFWMKTTEVTQAEWQAVMGNNPSEAAACGARCPVENVEWYQAIAFANALSLRDGYPPCYDKPAGGAYDTAAAGRREIPLWTAGLACRGYRLATEAEWEYAARAGTSTAYPDGTITRGTSCSALDPALDRVGWYCANTSGDPEPAATKQPNPWGLYDMHGNVWEWLWDRATDGDDYPASPVTDPLGPTSGSRRRDRGGSYFNGPHHCRSANRDSLTPDSSFADTGFRLARSAF